MPKLYVYMGTIALFIQMNMSQSTSMGNIRGVKAARN